MKNKIGMIGLITLTSALLITGCGKSKPTLEVKIKDGHYVRSFQKDTDEDSEYITLEVSVKNNSDKKIHLGADNFALYEKGDEEKIKPEAIYDFAPYSYSSKDQFGTELSNGKSTTATLIFEVEKGKEYQLAASKGMSSLKEAEEDVEIPLDLKKYEKTKSDFKQAEDALAAYIDVVFLNKPNDNYQKLIATDKDQAIEAAKNTFVKELKQYSFWNYKLTDQQASQAFEQFREVQAKRSSCDLTTVGFYKDLAKVNVKLEVLSRKNIDDLIDDQVDAYFEATDSFDYSKAEEDAFNKYKEILEKSDLVKTNDKLDVNMSKKDGKWEIKMKNTDGSKNEYLFKSYIGDVMD